MLGAVVLHPLDVVTFVLYFVGIVGLGVWLALREKATTREYFLAGDRLPWYAIGASVLASNISTEQFIGMVGWAYTYGFVIANFEWGAWLTWSVALWFFLPFYAKARLYTTPDFLERRYNRTCRYLLSLASIITYVLALEGGVLYAGSKALNVMFGMSLFTGVLVQAIATGLYTIAGGLLSVVWTDAVQCVLFIVGGLAVTVLGLMHVGGLGALMDAAPDKFFMFHLVHDKCPIVAYYVCSLFVGAYYVSSNQFLIQRCLGARSEWDGRMGLLFSNFLKLLMPLIVVLPGIIAFRLLPGLKDPDQAYPTLVSMLLGPGMFGLLMSALAAAIMSTVSSAVNSAATLFTLDLYKPLIAPDAGEAQLVRVGKLSSAALLIAGTVLALFYTRLQDPATGQPLPVFSLIMNIFFFIGPPLSIVFLAGIFWSRATPAAAVWTIIGGYVLSLVSQYVLFTPAGQWPQSLHALLLTVPALGSIKGTIDASLFLQSYNSFLYVAIWNGILSLLIMVAVSLVTRPRPLAEIRGLLWRPAVMRVGANGDTSSPAAGIATRSLVFWWVLCMTLTAALYAYFAWFQLRHQ